jgi:uncharacterized protein (DUF1684 family)
MKKLLIYLGILAGVAGISLLTWRHDAEQTYIRTLLRDREKRDLFMKSSPESPFTEEGRERFAGLTYFPPDPTYRVPARLIPVGEEKVVPLTLTGGAVERYLEAAYAEFELQGGSYRLLLLRQSGDDTTNRLFLAFRDSTSGRETYGGGRYLDLYQQNSNEVFIDFNRAYNPYCVYNSAYSCPLPPAENDLQLAVRAGERIYPMREGSPN